MICLLALSRWQDQQKRVSEGTSACYSCHRLSSCSPPSSRGWFWPLWACSLLAPATWCHCAGTQSLELELLFWRPVSDSFNHNSHMTPTSSRLNGRIPLEVVSCSLFHCCHRLTCLAHTVPAQQIFSPVPSLRRHNMIPVLPLGFVI